ncbi:hypothetical protein RHOFW104R3_15905 [Rhodanobacter denitrificans]|nr:hypothetical protein RHOFW104R3_15905 [Rhodanobacter denitrificans]
MLLRQSLAAAPHHILPLCDAIAALDESLRSIAAEVLRDLPDIELTSVASSEQLYVVLVEVFKLDLDEREEIAYARLLANSAKLDYREQIFLLSAVIDGGQ